MNVAFWLWLTSESDGSPLSRWVPITETEAFGKRGETRPAS